MKYIKTIIALAMICGTLPILASCDDDNNDSNYKELKLTADKFEINADGTQSVKFTVLADGQDVTSKARIASGQTVAPNGVFVSGSPGKFDFTATFAGLTSNEISIQVYDPDLVLSADKDTIQADGEDTVTFTVTYKGEDVTSASQVCSDSNGICLPPDPDGKYSYKTTSTGDHTFYAEYNSIKTPLYTIKASAGSSSGDEFYRMVSLFRFTSVYCSPCTGYAGRLANVLEKYPDRVTQTVIHGDMTAGKDPFTPSVFWELVSAFIYEDRWGFPYSNYDMRRELQIVGALDEEDIENSIKTVLDYYPATTGFYVESTLNGNTAEVSVTVKSSYSDEYNLGVILVEDKLMAEQAYYEGLYEHNNTFRRALTPYRGIDLRLLENGQTETRDFTVDLTGFEIENCKLVVYTTQVKSGGQRVINNSAYARLDGVTEYRYEMK